MKLSKSLTNLIIQFKLLPGIGQKTAERLAFFILRSELETVGHLAEALLAVKEKVKLCSTCNSITETDTCGICNDQKRNSDIICVVEEPNDIFSIEKAKEFQGKYHVLMGALSPLDGVGPSDLKIEQLINRIQADKIKEVIIATNPNTEGEATALYLAKILRPFGARVTRIAMGLPIGGDLEYADEVTILKSIQGRQEMC